MKQNLNPLFGKSFNGRNEKNCVKFYEKSGLRPFFLCSVCLTSIFFLFFLYSPHSFLVTSKHPLPHFISSVKIPNDDEKCDLFKGKWIQDVNGSRYTSSSCMTIPESKNCFKNGRSDSDFVNWRWKPSGCELPRFDPHKFLRIVGGKKLAFIGDSVARNQMESLLCLLSQAETPIDVYKDSEDRFRTWHFPASNFTLMKFWSKFLVKCEERMVNNTGTGIFNLHFDKIDEKWALKLPELDYAIISDAHWFFRKNYLYDQGKLIGCVFCSEPNVTNFGLNYSLRRAFGGALNYINNECKDCKKGLMTIVRTFSPAHFESGSWNSGGGCNRTRPIDEEMVKKLGKESELDLRDAQIQELERATKDGLRQGKRFRAVDITKAMLLRPDGHPGEFWGNKWMKGYNDCVHWCLPGPIDVWNDLLLAVLMQESRL